MKDKVTHKITLLFTDKQWDRIEKATIRKINKTGKLMTMKDYCWKYINFSDKDFWQDN